jgi:WhiB family redox-sensing transcriptional regulator
MLGSEFSWQEKAKCLGMDPEIFFPPTEEEAWRAKEVCRGCPVRRECLEFALKYGERYGVWGGFSEQERKALFRELASTGVTSEALRRVVERAVEQAERREAAQERVERADDAGAGEAREKCAGRSGYG